MRPSLTPETVRAFTAVMDPVAWATESHKLAEEHAYRDRGVPIKTGTVLGNEYSEASAPIVDEQLTKAGLRLAKLLNDIFDPGAAMPETPSAPIGTSPDNPASAPAPDKPGPAAAPEVRPGVKFVGSRDSEVYHYPGCSVVRDIKPQNLIEYTEAPAGKRLHQGCPR